MLAVIPHDIILHIFTFIRCVDIGAFCSAMNMKVQREWVFYSITQQIKHHAFKKRSICAQCNSQCITEIVYEDNQTIKWLPYCAIHVDQFMLHDVSIFCIGGLDANGNPLLLCEE